MAGIRSNHCNMKQEEKFHSLTEKLISLTETRVLNKNSINSNLSDLNELNLKSFDIADIDTTMLLLNNLLRIAQPQDTSLVRNICQFIVNLIQSNKSFKGRTLAACKRWVTETLDYCQATVLPDILFALQNLLLIEKEMNQYLMLLLCNEGILNKFLSIEASYSIEVTAAAVGCLGAILASRRDNKTKISQDFLFVIKNTAISIIYSLATKSHEKQLHCKILSSCLQILRALIKDKLISTSSDLIGEILGIVQIFLFYGMKDYAIVQPTLLRPAAMNLPDMPKPVMRARISKNDKIKPRRSTKKNDSEKTNTLVECKGICKYSSDSDISDNELNNSNCMDMKLRFDAIYLLQALVTNAESREIFGYWPQIVATGSKSNSRVLTRSVLKETSPKVKQNVLSVLAEMLINATRFLAYAEDSEHTAFVTFFNTVGLMIKELHHTLCLTLSTEQNVAVLTHALKCTSALVQGTPYARLKPGLATKLLRNTKLYIFHTDPTVQVAALSVFEALASSNIVTQEMLEILGKSIDVKDSNNLSYTPNDGNVHISASSEQEEIDFYDINDRLIDDFNKSSITQNNETSFLINICLSNVTNESVKLPVKLQSLKLLRTLIANTSSLVLDHLKIITDVMLKATGESETPSSLHACRVLEIIAGVLCHKYPNESYLTKFWSIAFDPIIQLLQNEKPELKAAACDCLGNIGSTMLSQLPRYKTIEIITVLFSTVRDEEAIVRAAGLRALGMLVSLPNLEDDTGFLMDLADFVCLASDDLNLSVRIKSIWALANLCDCLAKRKTFGQEKDMEPVCLDALLPRLYHVAVKATKSDDNIKSNAVRAVGNIMFLCPERQYLKDTAVGLDALISCATLGGDMKVRWNACRALGQVLSADPDNILPANWREQVFPALSSLICNSLNFKVRMNAAWALSVCSNYDRYVVMLWKKIILAFENTQHVSNYVEYPHRDALVQQLCLTLSHLAVHTQITELQSLWFEIGDHIDDISGYLKQFMKTALPEKTADIITAKARFDEFANTVNNSEERQIARTLAGIFDKVNFAENSVNT